MDRKKWGKNKTEHLRCWDDIKRPNVFVSEVPEKKGKMRQKKYLKR